MPPSFVRIPSASATAVVPVEAPPSIKFISAAVEVTAVLPKTSCPSGTTILAAPLRIKSSTDVSQVKFADAVSP